MDAIEKRARELLASAYRATEYPPMVHESKDLMHGRLDRREQAAMDAIITALTPPDGYVPERSVLIAATRLRKLASAATPMARSAYIKAAEMVEMAVIAARPEVKP